MNLSGSSCFRRVFWVVVMLLSFPAISFPAWAQFETRGSEAFLGWTYSLATGDFNHDGKLDVVASYGGGFLVALGNGDGTLGTTLSYPTQPSYWLAVAHFYGDRKLDI